jgi:hypothetical protein
LEAERWAANAAAGLRVRNLVSAKRTLWVRAGQQWPRRAAPRTIRAALHRNDSPACFAGNNCAMPACACCRSCPSSFDNRRAPAPSSGHWEGRTPWSAQAATESVPGQQTDDASGASTFRVTQSGRGADKGSSSLDGKSDPLLSFNCFSWLFVALLKLQHCSPLCGPDFRKFWSGSGKRKKSGALGSS